MAFFRKTEKKATVSLPKAVPTPVRAQNARDHTADVFRNPRITEKATDLEARNVYVFDVAPHANKRSIVSAVKHIYGVTPRMVRIVRVPSKTRKNMRTGKVGVTTSGKKAYIYLKQGDAITIA